MYSGVLCLIIRGLMHERVGGIKRVFRLAVDTQRINELWRIGPEVTQVRYKMIGCYLDNHSFSIIVYGSVSDLGRLLGMNSSCILILIKI